MENTLPFYQYLTKFVELSKEEYELYVLPFVIIRKFDKREVITRAGEVEDYLNFILKGLVRKYYKFDGSEVNIQIAHEGHIIHAQESFHSRTPSEYYVETLEPATFVSITFNNLEKVYSFGKKMERLGRLVITFTMVLKDQWQMQVIKLQPRERFIDFVNRHPDLLQRVPQKHLASFLNIKPETFSRFKHLLKLKSIESE
jgi:CRP-like cAMP-binding protein